MKLTFASFSIILGLVAIFMIAGLYGWIFLGLDAQNQQLLDIERQNKILNNQQLHEQNITLANQHIIRANQDILRLGLADIHTHLSNQTLNATQLRAFDSDVDLR